MMTNFKTYAFAALLAGAMALPLAGAHAENNKTSNADAARADMAASQTFKTLDADKSGSLSEAEFNAYTNASVGFDDADANSDGKLTLSELQNIPTSPSAKKPTPMAN